MMLRQLFMRRREAHVAEHRIDEQQVFSVGELADEWRVSHDVIRKAIREKRIHAFRPFGSWRITRQEKERVERGEKQAGAP